MLKGLGRWPGNFPEQEASQSPHSVSSTQDINYHSSRKNKLFFCIWDCVLSSMREVKRLPLQAQTGLCLPSPAKALTWWLLHVRCLSILNYFMDFSSLCRVVLCSQGDGLTQRKVMNIKKKSEGWWRGCLLACMPGVLNWMFLSPKGGTFSKAFSSTVRVFGDRTFQGK